MDVDLSIHSIVANIDYSPTSESLSQDLFGQAYYADLYATLPDQSLDTFFDDTLDDSYFGCSVSSIEFPVGLDYPSAFQPAPRYDQLELNFASSVDTASILEPNVPVTSTTTISSARSPREKDALATPPLSPSSLKCETPDSSTSPVDEPILKRRRGRPRLDFKLSGSIGIPSPKRLRRTSCVPHNQVERKYRDGLNSELERLRRVIPALSHSDEGAVIGSPKPTKAMVLSCAIGYIKKIELEKDELRGKYEQLGGKCGGK